LLIRLWVQLALFIMQTPSGLQTDIKAFMPSGKKT